MFVICTYSQNATGACGSVVVDNRACTYTNEDRGQPFDRYVGKYTIALYHGTIFVNSTTFRVN